MAENQFPPEVYGVFCQSINQDSAQKLGNTFSVASNGGVQHIHLLFQSIGGTVNEGIYLHNLFKALPLKLTLYNAGQVSSAAAVAYLGAQSRKASAGAVFLLHRTTNTATGATSDVMADLGKSLVVDDSRTETILREGLRLPDELWAKHSRYDLYLTAKESVEYGLADEIADFSPPFGSKIFTV